MNLIKLKSTVFRRRKPTKMLSAVKVDFYCTLQNMVIVLIIVMCSRCVIVTHYQLLIETACITISLRARQFQFYFTICILVCLYDIFELKKNKNKTGYGKNLLQWPLQVNSDVTFYKASNFRQGRILTPTYSPQQSCVNS